MKTKLPLGLALVLSGGLLTLTGGCATAESERTRSQMTENQPDPQKLLRELNDLENEYGNRSGKYTNYDVAGEVVARMRSIESELKKLGYVAVWEPDTGYKLKHIR